MLVTLLLIIHFFINQVQLLIDKKILYYILGLVLISFFLFYATRITYTADYDMYSAFYNWNYEDTDVLFRNINSLYREKQWGFHAVFATHIVAITVLFSSFILKFNHNLFYIFTVFIILIFIPYINQIRYYVAFPSFLLAAYYLIYNRKLVFFVFFAVLGFMSHSAVVVLYTFFLFYYFMPEKYYAAVLKAGAAILFVGSYLVSKTSLITYLEHFGGYLSAENQSSILGGVFNILPTLALLLPLYIMDKNYKGNKKDLTYIFLKKVSFFTTILIPASIFIQIIGQRYVFPFLVVWIVFFLYLIKEKKFSLRIRYVIGSYFLVAIVLYLQYGLANIVFGKSFYIEEVTETIESINNYR